MPEKRGTAQRETWRDWCAAYGFGRPRPADPRLITREELLATLEQWGVETTRRRPIEEHTLRHWAKEGLIPNATVEGEEGYQRALYPWWVADLIRQLRHYQDGGMGVERLRTWIRGDAHRLSRMPDWRVPTSPQLAEVTPLAPVPLPREFSPEIIPPVARLLRKHRQARGIDFVRAELHLVAASGESLVYTVAVRQHPLEPPEGG